MTAFAASNTVRDLKARGRRAWTATAILLAGGCATTLVSEPIERRADGWTITLDELTDGPNEVGTLGGAYRPLPGMRFLHATFTFRNDSAQPRRFGYDACDLDLEQERLVPGFVAPALGMDSKTETYAPGARMQRTLTFSYPEGRFPTRIKCAYVTFDLVQVPRRNRSGG
jgi:hypothetical protein